MIVVINRFACFSTTHRYFLAARGARAWRTYRVSPWWPVALPPDATNADDGSRMSRICVAVAGAGFELLNIVMGAGPTEMWAPTGVTHRSRRTGKTRLPCTHTHTHTGTSQSVFQHFHVFPSHFPDVSFFYLVCVMFRQKLNVFGESKITNREWKRLPKNTKHWKDETFYVITRFKFSFYNQIYPEYIRDWVYFRLGRLSER